MAVEDIRISLQLLAETVENLENEIDAKEAARAEEAKEAKKAASSKNMPPQMDMFGGWSPRPANDKNNALLAKKLDSTIDRIQSLLKEGAA